MTEVQQRSMKEIRAILTKQLALRDEMIEAWNNLTDEDQVKVLNLAKELANE